MKEKLQLLLLYSEKERIKVKGGGVFSDVSKFIDRIYKEAKKWAQPIGITQVKIGASAIGNIAGLYGAGFLAKQCTNASV